MDRRVLGASRGDGKVELASQTACSDFDVAFARHDDRAVLSSVYEGWVRSENESLNARRRLIDLIKCNVLRLKS